MTIDESWLFTTKSVNCNSLTLLLRFVVIKGKGSPYSITKRRVPELIPVLGSQPAGDVSHKPGNRLPLLSPGPQLPFSPIGRYQFRCLVNRGTMGVNSLSKSVARQCDLTPGPTAPESSTLTNRLPSHPDLYNSFLQ